MFSAKTRGPKSLILFLVITLIGQPCLSSIARAEDEPPPCPTPDIDSNYQRGYQEGQQQGSSEGTSAGNTSGASEGDSRGRNEGFNVCARDEAEKERDRGYHEGYRSGENDGDYAGRREGDSEGERRGSSEGHDDGINRSENDAQNAAYGPGSEQGYREAERSDASERGARDGDIAGDTSAKNDALRIDYPAGRKAVRDAYFAERVQEEYSFSQRPTFSPSVLLKEIFPKSAVSLSKRAFLKTFRAQAVLDACDTEGQERAAYEQGKSAGYQSSYQSAYYSAYQAAYDNSYHYAYQSGCSDARSRNYQSEYNQGFSAGHDEGYRDAYRRAYDPAYRSAYDEYFRRRSQEAYGQNYAGAYDRHYEAARSAAYDERTGEMYRATYNVAHARRYNQMYPGYAAQQNACGRVDEEKDFQERPVRLLTAEVRETNDNGLQEPGETLRVAVKLRNFGVAAIEGRNLKIQVFALQSNKINIGINEEILVKEVRAKSIANVNDVLELQLLESAIGKATSVKIVVLNQGRSAGEAVVELAPKFLAKIALSEIPKLQEGLPMPVKFTVTNQSPKAMSGALTLQLSSDPKLIEVVTASASLASLAVGESKQVEFTVIARKGGVNLSAPLSVSASIASGLRVGLVETVESFPLINDYKIVLKGSTANLRNAGVTKVEYTIQNVSKRSDTKSLQLWTRFREKNADNFNVIGPNPQLLKPIRSGQTLSFVVPVNAKLASSGGVIELEVKEQGRVVVLSRVEF